MARAPNNKEIAALLGAIADALEIKAEDAFRARAFRSGARRVETAPVDVATTVLEGKLDSLPGIGTRMGNVIADYVKTGASPQLEEARAGIPAGVFELLMIQGVGTKTASRLFNELEIVDVDGLEAAAKSGRLRQLPGMGPKKVQRFQEEIARLHERRGTFRLGDALPEMARLLGGLEGATGVTAISPAGPVRRGAATVRGIDIVLAATDANAVAHALGTLAATTETTAELVRGETAGGIPVTLHLATPEDFAVTLLRQSGSAAHLARLESIASEQGIDFGAAGPLRRGAAAVRVATEAELYEVLGLQFVAAELREDRGEVEAARAGRLPRLVELGDLRGDLHAHTRWSDGAHTIAEMAAAARRLGHDYLVISDHSQSLTVAQGLTPERLREQRLEVEAVDAEFADLRLFQGTETDILTRGGLDFEDAELAELDWVTASVHTAFQQSREAMTARMLTAIRNPWADSIGHPTGRLLNAREGYELDTDAVFAAAAETGTAMEINAMPDRLDLSDELARRAVEMGVDIVINTDAHAAEQLGLLPYGVVTARRAGITHEQVVNTRDVEALREWRRARMAKAGL
ncbi:MAG: DNA polymerase/3'-5' exonuclease PolX [Chloroflexota bacterium]|nr:DNA polymerase/3'-5' exonuclease PolX [Chloroflexota bacterium]MDP6509534.1 DNA polymerase/3'-5' exonuclease PolX [Chloroflexota bacterium]MDP6758142.1 DNA polymerase/3'-5' exonuclease PolX [Chloroflexota bacterium]